MSSHFLPASRSFHCLLCADVVAFLKRCQLAGGGYAGGPGQLPHLAPTYAAVATLVTIGGAEALSSIQRAEMAKFLEMRCRAPSNGGGFQVCEGEIAEALSSHSWALLVQAVPAKYIC